MDALEMFRTAMWIVASATALVTLILGLILGYHWNNYSGNSQVAKISILAFAIVSIALLLVMFGFIPA